MASLNFTRAYNNGECEMMEVLAPNTIYKGYYCDPKLDRSTMPEGWYAYDFRTDDDGCGIFCEICHNYVMVNNGGTFFTQNEITELREADSYKLLRIDPEEWKECHLDGDDDIEEIENPEDAWDYSFTDWETEEPVIEEKKEDSQMIQGVVFMSDEEANSYKAELDAKLKEM